MMSITLWRMVSAAFIGMLGVETFEQDCPASDRYALVGAIVGADSDATEDVFAPASIAFDDCFDPLNVIH